MKKNEEKEEAEKQ